MKNLMLATLAAILALSFGSQGWAQDAAKPTLHVIVVADIHAGNAGLELCVKNTIEAHENMLSKVEETMEGELIVNKQVFKGNNWTGTAVIEACSNLNVKSNDAVYFIYNGHGFRTAGMNKKGDKWPALSLQHKAGGQRDDIKLSNIFNKLNSKNPRLLVVISESCNSYVNWIPTPSTRGVFRKQMCKDLFVNSKGSYIASGSIAGEVTWGPSGGCRLTHELMKNIDATLSANEYVEATSGWNAIFTKSAQPLTITLDSGRTVTQHPQFEKDPVIGG